MTTQDCVPADDSSIEPLEKQQFISPNIDFELLIDVLDKGVLSADRAGLCNFVNPVAIRLLGFKLREEIIGKNLLTLFPLTEDDQALEGVCSIHEALFSPKKYRLKSVLLPCHNSPPLLIDLYTFPLYQEDNWVGTVISFIKANDSQLKELMRQLFGAVESAADPVMMTDYQGNIEYVNPAFEMVTGHTAKELLGRKPALLRSGIQEKQFYDDMWKTINRGTIFRGVFINRKKDGSLYNLEQTITPLKGKTGEITHFVSIAKDLSNCVSMEERFWQLAHHDVLTGLPNRVLFRDRLEQATAHAQRNNKLSAIIFIDLDGFKTINDSLGHSIGDLVLKAVGERLVTLARSGDTVARLNGDEFGLVAIDIYDKKHIATLAREILEGFADPFMVASQEFYITVSIGIAVYPFDGELTDDLIRAAETAMYRAKEDGRNSFRFFTSDMTTRIVQRLALETQLRRALQLDEFFLEYQPLVNTSTGKIRSVEALLRWRHPQRGVVGPNEFIPVLEESGMINPVGSWVLKTACSLFAASNDPELNPIRFAVNLSAHQFRRNNLIKITERILAEAGTDPNRLVFEITESVLIKDAAKTKAILTAFKDMGIQIAIDDFGTGYSSLGYLQHFPIDTLKIDRAFVVDLVSKKETAALVKAIVAMADALGMNVVAEGVETHQQIEILHEYGCDIIQGHAISLPLAPENLKMVLAEDYRFSIDDREDY